ncbi:Isocitrate dehydrogenase kinase/phosphatase [Frankliniella fusca]|uniref:Isocitrate dehydrogenase kinase/phosphatase n=1 Tax=Frankliniella fusca TaxID=407009 RepID=A0AAE1LLB6_9NEOP|nr:Isocitrate dehydrogenase kinase/phosphatase [Frankliniella fusca]
MRTMFVFCYYEYQEDARCLRCLPVPLHAAPTLSDEIRRGWAKTFDGSVCKVCGQQILRRYNLSCRCRLIPRRALAPPSILVTLVGPCSRQHRAPPCTARNFHDQRTREALIE